MRRQKVRDDPTLIVRSPIKTPYWKTTALMQRASWDSFRLSGCSFSVSESLLVDSVGCILVFLTLLGSTILLLPLLWDSLRLYNPQTQRSWIKRRGLGSMHSFLRERKTEYILWLDRKWVGIGTGGIRLGREQPRESMGRDNRDQWGLLQPLMEADAETHSQTAKALTFKIWMHWQLKLISSDIWLKIALVNQGIHSFKNLPV